VCCRLVMDSAMNCVHMKATEHDLLAASMLHRLAW
jgi:hypothetical protein